MNALAFMIVFCRCITLPIGYPGVKVHKRANPIVAPDKHFQHQLSQSGAGLAKPAGEQADEGLRTFHQRLYSLGPVGGPGIGSEVGEVSFQLGIYLPARRLKQWLIEIAIAHLPGHVADGREQLMGYEDDAPEKSAKPFVGAWRKIFDAPQAAFKDEQNRRDLLLQPLMRFVDPKQAVFQFRRTIQCRYAVVGEGTLQSFDKSRG